MDTLRLVNDQITSVVYVKVTAWQPRLFGISKRCVTPFYLMGRNVILAPSLFDWKSRLSCLTYVIHTLWNMWLHQSPTLDAWSANGKGTHFKSIEINQSSITWIHLTFTNLKKIVKSYSKRFSRTVIWMCLENNLAKIDVDYRFETMLKHRWWKDRVVSTAPPINQYT